MEYIAETGQYEIDGSHADRHCQIHSGHSSNIPYKPHQLWLRMAHAQELSDAEHYLVYFLKYFQCVKITVVQGISEIYWIKQSIS